MIASHDSVHAEQVVAAVRAGKPVLCEKPLAPTLAEARLVLREIGRGGEPLLSLGFMRRFDPGYVELRAAIDSGRIGAPVIVHNVSRGVASAAGSTSESSITGSAIHEFDVVPWLLRSPVVEASWIAPRCSSRVTGLQDPQLIHLRTADGVLSTVETFLNSTYGYVMRCEVVGETGTVSLTEPARVVVDAERTRSIGYAADWRPRFADAYRLELQAWVDAVAAGRPTSLATARDGVLAGAVADAVITSMREGGRVWRWRRSDAPRPAFIPPARAHRVRHRGPRPDVHRRSAHFARRTTAYPLVRVRSFRYNAGTPRPATAAWNLVMVVPRSTVSRGIANRSCVPGRDGVVHRARRLVARGRDGPSHPRVEVAERIGHGRHRPADLVFEQRLVAHQLLAERGVADLVELRVAVAVPGHLDPVRGGLLDLAPREHPIERPARGVRPCVVQPAGGDEQRGREAELVEDRQRLGVEIGVAVVEGDHDGPRGQRRSAVAHRRGEIGEGERREPAVPQVPELVGEVGGPHGQPAGLGGGPVGHRVVHQNRDAHGQRRPARARMRAVADPVAPCRAGEPDHDRAGPAEPRHVASQGVAQPAQHTQRQGLERVAALGRQPVRGPDAVRHQSLRQALRVAAAAKIGELAPGDRHLVVDHRVRFEHQHRAGAPLGQPDAELGLLTPQRPALAALHACARSRC